MFEIVQFQPLRQRVARDPHILSVTVRDSWSNSCPPPRKLPSMQNAST
jgi:hypothetical protein